MSTGQHWKWDAQTTSNPDAWSWDHQPAPPADTPPSAPDRPPTAAARPRQRSGPVHIIAARNLVGTVLDGHIVLDSLLGSDPFGDLYAAHSDVIKLDLAARLLNPSVCTHAPGVANYIADFEATASFNSVHVAGTIAWHLDGLQPFVARHHLPESITLRALLAGEPLPSQSAFLLTSRIANALAELHDLRVLHRNLTSRTIRVIASRAELRQTPEAASTTPFQIVDWGQHLLVAARAPMVAHRKNPDGFFGFPETMSPEQVRAEPAEVRSDVYALGCVLYELLTGKAPFTSHDFAQTLQRHIYEKPLRPGIARRDVHLSTDEAEVVMKALAKRPEDRFASLDAFAIALEALGYGHHREPALRPRLQAATTDVPDPEAPSPTDTPSLLPEPTPDPPRPLDAQRQPAVAGMHCLRINVAPAATPGLPTVHVAIDVLDHQEVLLDLCDARGDDVAVLEDLVAIPRGGSAEVFFKLRGPLTAPVNLVVHDVDNPHSTVPVEGAFEVTEKVKTAPWHPHADRKP